MPFQFPYRRGAAHHRACNAGRAAALARRHIVHIWPSPHDDALDPERARWMRSLRGGPIERADG
jgi:hypothetical protein